MERVESRIRIRAPRVDVFDLTQSYDLRLEWDPFLRELRFLNGATEPSVGVLVWVKAKNGLTMEVEYVSLTRPKVVAMKMLRGPRIFESFAGTWRFEEVTENETDVTFIYAFETIWAWARVGLNPLIRAAFRRDIRARLLGLKKEAESGRLISRMSASD